MVVLPTEFIATKFPGYFFNIKNNTLYSIKIGGTLRALPLVYPNRFNHQNCAGFNISVQGCRRFYPLPKLLELKDAHKLSNIEVIPVK